MKQSAGLRELALVAVGLGFLSVFLFGCKGTVSGKTQCFSYRDPTMVTVGKRTAAYTIPLSHEGNLLGYINAGQDVVLVAMCEGASGTDLKVSPRNLAEGYVAAADLIPGFPVVGTKVVLPRRMLYKDADAAPDNFVQFFSGPAVILEGPRPSTTTPYVFKIRGVDPPNVTGWVPGWAVDDDPRHLRYYMILPEGVEANTAADNNRWSWESGVSRRVQRWMGTVILIVVGFLFVRNFTLRRAAGWLLVMGFGLTVYELWSGEYGRVGLGVVAMIGGLVAAYRTAPKPEKADYGIPHCEVERKADGFTVSFRHRGPWPSFVSSLLAGVFVLVGIPFCIVAGVYSSSVFGGLIATLLSSALFCLLAELMAAAERAQNKTVITVTRDTVIVGGRKLNRADFGGFRVTSETKERGTTGGWLGYAYGVRTFDLPIMLEQPAANEFVAGLNAAMRRLSEREHVESRPQSGTTQASPEADRAPQMTAEQLRRARPTDF